VRFERDAGTGEFWVLLVGQHEGLVGVVSFNYDLRHAPEGITPQHPESERLQGSISYRREGSSQRRR